MKRILWVVLSAALAMSGCADPVAPTTPVPATPTITDTFSDTLLVLGSNTHQFTVATVGGVKVSLTSVQPGAAVGLGVGTPSLGSCSVIDRVSTVAGQAAQLSGTATVPGSYCVVIFDLVDPTSGVGSLVEPVAYTINVLHS
jgi:hypothetical protein